MPQSNKTAIILVFDGVEELEAIAPIDILRRADVEVTIAAIGNSLSIAGRNGIVFHADTILEQTDPQSADLLILPGGPGVLKFVDDDRIHNLLRNRDRKGKLTAAICAAPKAFANAGIIDRRQATSHASVRDSIPNPSEQKTVADGHIVTSQGAGTAIDFGLKLVSLLSGDAIANEIASSIHSD